MMVPAIAELSSFLRKANRSLRQASLHTLNMLVTHQHSKYLFLKQKYLFKTFISLGKIEVEVFLQLNVEIGDDLGNTSSPKL